MAPYHSSDDWYMLHVAYLNFLTVSYWMLWHIVPFYNRSITVATAIPIVSISKKRDPGKEN